LNRFSPWGNKFSVNERLTGMAADRSAICRPYWCIPLIWFYVLRDCTAVKYYPPKMD
jgi:hypothetical protein